VVQLGSFLRIKDNSGACWVKCINIIGKSKMFAYVGDIILVSVIQYYIQDKLERRAVYLGIIVGCVYWTLRVDGSYVKFFSNCVLLFSKKYKFIGTRVYGLFLKEVNIVSSKNKQLFLKVLSYARGLI
jgi:large subunit ribosomal protein L14